MKRFVAVLVAAGLAASGAAVAQTTPNNNPTTGVTPGTGDGAVTPGAGLAAGQPGVPPSIGGAAPGTAVGVMPNGTQPTVENTAVGGGMTPGAAPMSGATPMMNASHRDTNGSATARGQGTMGQTPVSGANSFTMGQARARIQHDGFTQLTGLHKDRHGVWRGKAMKDGQPANVALDYQGKIFGQ